MIPTVWEHVHPGAVVLLNREPWHVVDRTGHAFTVRHPSSGRTVGPRTLPPQDPVTVLEPGDRAYVPTPREAAVATVLAPLAESALATLATTALRIHLGAQLIATEDATGLTCHTVDVWHLVLFHAFETELPDDAPAELIHTVHNSSAATKPHRHAEIPHPS